jgi:2-succinyl-5-enolpyruvyl-6-hydroxy-3-cyclohexene-1-carboxylate synthase
MSTKTLVGVLHDDEDKEEMQQVIDLIDDKNPATIGLEIINEDSRTNQCPPYFDEIHDYTQSKGIKPVPLEHQLAYEKFLAIDTVVRVVEGNVTRKYLEYFLKYTTTKLKQRVALKSSEIRALEQNKRRINRALKMLDKCPSQEEVIQMYATVMAEREKHMLSRIQRHQPDLVIIGVAHAEAIRDRLPEYEYIRLAKEEAEGIF